MSYNIITQQVLDLNMIARAVIGANFGDEGKGLMTDYLVYKHQSNLVVRFNGGAQAGHTVQTSDGRRHVFGHFGSGSFAGAATLLSRFFIVNPMVFRKEREELLTKPPVNLSVTLDLDAFVTTPFEMLLNQMVEQSRGDARHGSCGLGINETIERDEQFVPIRVRDLTNEVMLAEKLYAIRDFWVPIRKTQLGLGSEHDNILMSDILIDRWLADVEYMLENTTQGSDTQVLATAKNPIFEGAQGLMLDQNHDYFPYVTRSNTGIKNVLVLMGANYRELEATYVTRSYLTRHGAGPMVDELDQKPYEKIVDDTNFPNQWQGTLRFAHLNVDTLRSTIYKDLMSNHLNHKVRPIIAITCLDQCGDVLSVFQNSWSQSKHCVIQSSTFFDVGDQLAKRIGISDNHYKSFGPTRENVVNYMEAADSLFEKRAHKTPSTVKRTRTKKLETA